MDPIQEHSAKSGLIEQAASFRDPENRVFQSEDRVLRGMSPRAAANWDRLSASSFFQKIIAEAKLVGTRAVDPPHDLGSDLGAQWAQWLEHDRIPFISYPYEWCFGMLKDAALLQLELLLGALENEMTLKDATPYNVQWQGSQPVFIDVPSFVALDPGEPWVGSTAPGPPQTGIACRPVPSSRR